MFPTREQRQESGFLYFPDFCIFVFCRTGNRVGCSHTSPGLSKADVPEFSYHNAGMPPHQSKNLAHYGNRDWPAWIDGTNPETLVPIVRAAEDIVVVVAGGDGRHSASLAGWGVTRLATEEIILPSYLVFTGVGTVVFGQPRLGQAAP
jgi:hypothetical protein